MTPFAAVKIAWLIGAVGLAGYLITRRKKLGRTTQVVGWLVALGAAAVGAGLIKLPNLEELILKVGETLGPWTYLLVGTLAFLETGAFIGLVAPGETAVIVGGLVAGQGKISLPILIALVWTCAVAGDLLSHTVGRRLGRDFLLRHGEKLKITEERLQTVEGFFDRHGGATILIGRFIGFVRALAPFVAGTARMPLRTFLPYDVLGAGAWGATFCVLGYVFWQSFHQLTQYVSRGLLAFALVVGVALGIWFLIQLRRDPERREHVRAWLAEREDSRAWRPFIRAAGPAWRWLGRPAAAGADEVAMFSWRRLTPGSLGLELTTLLALLAVGGFVFYLVGDAVRPGGTGGLGGADDAAANLAHDLADSSLHDVAKLASGLGSLVFVAAVVAVTAVGVAVRRRVLEAVALVAGLALSFGAVHLAKAAYDRPRPSGSLVETSLSSYPSAHAAYAVVLIACATVLVRAGAGWAVRIGAETVAIALVAAVFVARVYLGASHLTDAIGGVALGVAVWALAGSVALVVGHVRHNGDRSS
jgi:undecaprenyl-diphosphatase